MLLNRYVFSSLIFLILLSVSGCASTQPIDPTRQIYIEPQNELKQLPNKKISPENNYTFSEEIDPHKIKRIDRKFSSYYQRRVAVCIGIDNYVEMQNLLSATKDAKSMAALFKGYDFDEVYLLSNERATKSKIVNELLRFKGEADPRDLFVLYFAGHGETIQNAKGKDEGFLIAVDTQQNEIQETGISMRLFKDISETMPNMHMLFLVDTCFSGYCLSKNNIRLTDYSRRQDKHFLEENIAQRAVQIFTAGSKDEKAIELSEHGLFTGNILDVLTGKTNHKDDGVISVQEMAIYTEDKVKKISEGSQNPNLGHLSGTGDVFFIIGQQERIKRKNKKVLSLEEIEYLYKEAEHLQKNGFFLKADQKLTSAYHNLRRHQRINKNIILKYLKRLCQLALDMTKNDLSVYYANEILTNAYNNKDKAYGYNLLGRGFLNKGEYDLAQKYFEKSLKTAIAEYGSNHSKLTSHYNNLGLAHRDKCEYDLAIEYINKALEINLANFGPKDLSVSANYNNLSLIYDDIGDYNKSIEYSKKALKIDLARLGKTHSYVAIDYNNLGLAYDSKGEYNRAIESFEKALEITTATLGPDNPKISIRLNNLGTAYMGKGDFDRALFYYEKALEIIRVKLEPDHPDFAIIYKNFGMTYFYTGELDKSLRYCQKALKIAIEKYIPNHRRMAEIYNIYGLVLSEKGKKKEAVKFCQKAVNIATDTIGKNHPKTIQYQIDLENINNSP